MEEQSGHTTQIQDCLARLRDGDGAARAALIDHACRNLQQLTHRMLQGYPRVARWEQTDDVLNQAMIRLHRALAEVCPASPIDFLKFATTEIRRQLIDLARHYRRQGDLHATHGGGSSSGMPVLYEGADETHEPSSLQEWTEFHEAVESLPADEREVFGLRWYDQMTFPEIAHVLAITDRTAKRRWRKACVLVHQAMRGLRPGD